MTLRDHPALHAHIDAVIDITSDEMNTLAERMRQRCQEIATAAYQEGYSAGLREGVEEQLKTLGTLSKLMPKGEDHD